MAEQVPVITPDQLTTNPDESIERDMIVSNTSTGAGYKQKVTPDTPSGNQVELTEAGNSTTPASGKRFIIAETTGIWDKDSSANEKRLAYISEVSPITSSAKSANYTILDNDELSLIRMTTGSSTDKTVTLPTAADNLDREITVLKADSGTNYLILDGESTETIDYLGVQQTTITVELQGRGLKVKSNGASWDVVEVIGAEIKDINSTLEMIYENVYLGVLDNDTQTDITHNISDFDKIIEGNVFAKHASVGYFIHEQFLGSIAADTILSRITSTTLIIYSVGTQYQGNNYRAVLKYYI
jgi:hypothetical protein